jgi:hypothetical protein
MKTNLTTLKTIGFKNHAQRCVYAAFVLQAACVSSPLVSVKAAVAAVVAKAAVVAQTAKPARLASAAVAGTANTVGYGFGELYLNSPAYLAGTAIPAIAAKPASAAVTAVAAVVGVPAQAAIVAPAITALTGYSNAIQIQKTADYLDITAYFPIASSPRILGDDTEKLLEITPSALTASAYLGDKVGTELDGFDNLNYLPATLEEYFRFWAFQTVNQSFNAGGNTIEMYNLNGVMTRCRKYSLKVAATNYQLDNEDFQLAKIDYWTDTSGGGGGSSFSIVSPA